MTAHGADLTLRDLRMSYPTPDGEQPVFAGLELDVAAGSNVAVVGPSGCGKSTLLRLLSGLTRPTGGVVAVDGRTVTGPPDGLALVFQDYARSLFPWLTVTQNVALPLERTTARREREQLAARALASVGLGDVGRRYPWQLSGGMQQRVAIARALVTEPSVLLLDEPFAAVDAQTRGDLEDLVRDLWARLGVTVLLVTHDIDEAVYVSDRVIVLGARGAGVVDDVLVPLPAGRTQLTTRSSAEFGRTRARVLTAVQDATRRLRDRTTEGSAR